MPKLAQSWEQAHTNVPQHMKAASGAPHMSVGNMLQFFQSYSDMNNDTSFAPHKRCTIMHPPCVLLWELVSWEVCLEHWALTVGLRESYNEAALRNNNN